MGIVSVERFSLSLGDNVLTADGTLTKSQTTGNCIPFITSRTSVLGGATGDEFRQFCLQSFFPDGSTVRVERGRAGASQSQLVAEVTVVEFDGTDIEVQQGTYSIGASTASDVVTGISAVTLANTFLYHNWHRGNVFDAVYDSSAVRGRITGTQELTFDRIATDSTAIVTGRWYLADATTGGDFTVQAKDIDLATGDTSNTATLTSVTTASTFLLGSAKSNGTDQDGAHQNTYDVNLSNSTTISLQRDTSGGPLNWSGFAVEMTDNTSVQRGTRVQSTDLLSDSFDITAVTLADSWVHVAGSSGSMGGGSYPGGASQNPTDSFMALDFVDSDTIRMQHTNNSTASADNDISWEVIEWDIGAAGPSRRVMVVS